MLNFVGQDIRRGSIIGQVARTNQGMVRRVGVVMGENTIDVKGGPRQHLRVIWATFADNNWETSDAYVLPDNVFVLDGDSIDYPIFLRLLAAQQAGHA